jgi:hypothetical protein
MPLEIHEKEVVGTRQSEINHKNKPKTAQFGGDKDGGSSEDFVGSDSDYGNE